MNAVARLPILNETYYRDILCEIGGMFSIAKKVDNIHGRPWIGFQSWHAAGRKVSSILMGFYFYGVVLMNLSFCFFLVSVRNFPIKFN